MKVNENCYKEIVEFVNSFGESGVDENLLEYYFTHVEGIPSTIFEDVLYYALHTKHTLNRSFIGNLKIIKNKSFDTAEEPSKKDMFYTSIISSLVETIKSLQDNANTNDYGE